MENFFSQNIQSLEKKQPDLAKRLQSITSKGSLVSSADSIKSSIEKFDSNHAKIIVGYGAGASIPQLYDKEKNNAEYFLFIEKDISQFRSYLENIDFTSIIDDERTYFFVDLEDKSLFNIFLNHFDDGRKTFFVKSMVFWFNKFDNADYYQLVHNQFEKAVNRAVTFTGGIAEDSFRGFANIILNLTANETVPLFDCLENNFKGSIGVAISTGPSLKHSFEWLKQIEDRAIVCCTDSSLKILHEKGIRPHLTGCLERVPETKLLFEGMEWQEDTRLVTSPIIWPETYQNFPGPKINMMRPVGQMPWFFKEGKSYATGTSVSHLMLDILISLGCSRILLVGQDLAFDRHSEATHTEGIADLCYEVGQSQRQQSLAQAQTDDNDGFLVEGNDGQPILTMPWYDDFRLGFGRLIEAWGGECYNVIPKNYGAAIPHAIWCDPSQALSLLGEPQDIRGMIKEKLDADSGLRNASYRKAIQDRGHLAIKHLEHIEALALDMLNASSQFLQRYNPKYHGDETYNPFFELCEKIITEISEDEDNFYKKFFHAQVMDKTYALTQETQRLMIADIGREEKILSRFECIQNWFKNFHLWAARMRLFMVKNPY